MRKTVENQENLTLRQTMIDEILVENGKVVGVRTATHQEYGAKAVIVTTGTALRGEIIIGDLRSIRQDLIIVHFYQFGR